MFNDVTAEEHMNFMHIDSVYTLVTKIAFMPISIDVIKESNNHCLPTFSIALWKCLSNGSWLHRMIRGLG